MHALSIAQIRVELAEDEQNIQQHSLRIGLAEVEVLGHAAVDILLDLCAELFVVTDGGPWRLGLHLSYRSDHARNQGDIGTWAYFSLLAERVGLFIWILEVSEEVQAQRVVRRA